MLLLTRPRNLVRNKTAVGREAARRPRVSRLIDEVRRSVPEDVRNRQVIPGTTLADLDNVRPELIVIMGHCGEFCRDLCLTGMPSERIAIDEGHLGDVPALADRAGAFGRLAEVAGGAKEVGLRVTDVAARRPAGAKGADHRPFRQAVIHHPSLRPHERHTTAFPSLIPTTWRFADCRDIAPRRILVMYRLDTSTREGAVPVASGQGRVLELAVLGSLHETPLHGYELRKRLNALLGMFRAFSYGSLYPCLRSLLAQGLIAEEQPAPSTIVGGRSKIVYKLTAEGKERLQELLTQAGPSAWEDESFGVHFAFFRHTEAEVRLRILEGRRSRLLERLDAVRTALARTRERLDSYTLELQRHGLESVEREVRWLNELIATERRASSEGGPERDTTSTDE